MKRPRWVPRPSARWLERAVWPLGYALRRRRADVSQSLSEAPELACAGTLDLRSPSIAPDATIPAEFCGWLIGANRSPALLWGPLPRGTQSVFVLMEDLDVPTSAPAVHLAAIVGPNSTGAPPEGVAQGQLNHASSDVRFAPGSFGRAGYVGPRPIPGHGPHRYRVWAFALDIVPDLGGITEAGELVPRVEGHVLARGSLTGTRAA